MPDIGGDHLRQHAQISTAQANAYAHWREMTRAERRRARRQARGGARRTYLRAQSAAGAPDDVGSWAPPFVTASNWTGFAVHTALLRTGKILMWGAQGPHFGKDTYAWLWDPAQGYGPDAFRDVTPRDASGTSIPLFCSGMSFLPDGRLLVVGGTLAKGDESPDDEYEDWAGLNMAATFDPDSETWTELPRPDGSEGRWYPTQVLMPDGRTLVVSGFSDAPPGHVTNDAQELYDPETNAFTLLDSPLQRRSTDLYPHLKAMPDGTVLLAGADPADSAIFDPAALDDPWTDLPEHSGIRVYGNAVLLPEGTDGSSEVAFIGGHPWGKPSIATNQMIDLDDPTPSWSSFPALDVQRFNANTVLLPDRSMVTIGGDDMKDPLAPERAVELYDPETRSWRTGPSQVETRAYHSTALLLPDARVLSTGDDWTISEESPDEGMPDETGEIYSPPYLFKGPRPAISWAPRAVRWDVPFGVGAKGDIDDAVLVAPAAVTHANDMSQRLVPLEIVAEHQGGVTVQSPPSASVAPPSYYMLFLLSDGVPSVAKWVRLDGEADNVPATPPDKIAPTLRLRYAERGWLDRLRRSGRLAVRVRVDEPATVEVALAGRKRRVARKAFDTRPGKRIVNLRPRRRALRWLRDGHGRRLRLSAVATDAAHNDAVWARALRPQH